jgi:hypothetical protein
MQSALEIQVSFQDLSGEHMQIHEITLQLNENALGAFASGFAQGAGISVPDLGDQASPGGSAKYGPAAQQQAARIAEPLIAQQAQKELTLWNTSILDLLQQNKISSPAQLDTNSKQALAQSLLNQFHKNFTQNKLGSDYKSLPKLVDPKKQAEAQKIVNSIQQSLNSILNFNAPVQNKQTQLAQWAALSRAAYEAMSMVQFHPSKETRLQTRVPKLEQNPDGTYTLGGQKLNPQDPVDAKILQKIKAQQMPSSGSAGKTV